MVARSPATSASGPSLGRPRVVDVSAGGEAVLASEARSAEGCVGEGSRAGRKAGLSGALADFLELTKPRIVTMILVTTAIAWSIAAGDGASAWGLLHMLIGVGMVAGSAGAMNQVWEREIDARMERTRLRPLPDGRLGWQVGAAFAGLIGIAGSVYLWRMVGVVPALLAIATWVVYVPIYTPLKRWSQWNTTVGAVSGALPMLVGFTGGGGSLVDPIGWLLVGVLVAWQYPHFMAIAWLVREQYERAGFRMATTDDPTGRSAGWQSVLGMAALCGCLLGLSVLVVPRGSMAAVALALAVLAVSYPMFAAAVRFAGRRDDLTARRLLRASLLQLPASLGVLTLAAWFWGR